MEVDGLMSALDQGVAEGLLGGDEDLRGADVATARNWLFLLGYIERDDERSSVDAELEDALRRLQEDAGVVPAAPGLDATAFALLERLVSFDRDLEDDRFAGFDLGKPALERAAALRLYSLDFLPRRPDAGLDRDGLREALAAFADTYRLLGLGRLKAELAPETVAALFGHAALRRRFALEDGEAEPDHAPNASNQQMRKDRRAVRELADAVARIELWLIGYLARPRRLMEANDDTNKSLPAALRAFWRDQPAEAQPDKRLRNDAIGLFFRQAETITLTTADDDPLGSDEVLRDRLENDPELARQVVAETRSLGARIVDGVRRVARFIGNWIRRRLGGLLALARNIARALIGRTRKVFSAVRQIVSSLRDSWDFVFRKPVPGSDPRQLLVLHDRDFDFTLVAYAGADPARVTGLGRRLAALARLLRLAMSFLRQLTGAFVGVARRFGIGGWFGAVMALLEAGPRIQRMIVLAREMRAQREMLAADLA